MQEECEDECVLRWASLAISTPRALSQSVDLLLYASCRAEGIGMYLTHAYTALQRPWIVPGLASSWGGLENLGCEAH